MPEVLAGALLLVIVAVLTTMSVWDGRMAVALGVATAVLFFVRPNVGAIALCLGVIALWMRKSSRSALFLIAGFAALWLPMELAASPPRALQEGLEYPMYLASTDYFWGAPGDNPHQIGSDKWGSVLENWNVAFHALGGADMRRQMIWRALHGFFGLEFYDARWSTRYAGLRVASALLSTWLLFAAVAVLLAVPFVGEARVPKALGLLLVVLLIVQSLALGSLPRFVLPFLPSLLLLAVAALPTLLGASAFRRGTSLLAFAALALGAASQRQILDREWGVIESSGVRITQTIPVGALPDRGPATLHVRIAAPLLPTEAGLQLLGPSGETLYDSREDLQRSRPFITVPLADTILAANRRGPIDLTLVSSGVYNPTHYLLFPIIPAPWARPARRDGSRDLSPASGVAHGALDWWAHPGTS